MENLLSLIGKRGVVLTLAIIGATAGYWIGLSPEAAASSASKQACPNSVSCNGGNCTTKEACRKTGCGCGCQNTDANRPKK